MSFSIGPRLLVLARHGQSEGNQQNSFTGWRDLPLTAQGEGEARLAGERLREMGVAFGAAFTSKLSRASASSSLMLETMNQGRTTVESDVAGNESAYGDLTRPQQRSGPPAVRHRSGPCLAPLPRRGAPPMASKATSTDAQVWPLQSSTFTCIRLTNFAETCRTSASVSSFWEG